MYHLRILEKEKKKRFYPHREKRGYLVSCCEIKNDRNFNIKANNWAFFSYTLCSGYRYLTTANAFRNLFTTMTEYGAPLPPLPSFLTVSLTFLHLLFLAKLFSLPLCLTFFRGWKKKGSKDPKLSLRKHD